MTQDNNLAEAPRPATSASARIASVEARIVRLPLDKPVFFSTRRIEARFFTLVRITCTDGSEGYGFCHDGNRSGVLATAAIRELFRPVLLGEDPHRTEGLYDELAQDALLNGRAGAVMRGLSAVDMALWDRNARSVGLPLWRYMGASRKRTVPAYASGGYYREGGKTDEYAAEIQSYVDLGFNAVKIKIGAASPSKDLERIKIAREIIGPDGRLLLDANNAYKDLPTALQLLDPAQEYRPLFIEEPFGPEDLVNTARLAQRMPVASGEIAAGVFAFQELIQRGGVTVIQPDVGVCGGITEWRRVAAVAAGAGVSVAPHAFHHAHVHLLACIANGLFVEYFTNDRTSPFRRVYDRQAEIENGELVLPEEPGFGYDFDHKAVDKYATGAWE